MRKLFRKLVVLFTVLAGLSTAQAQPVSPSIVLPVRERAKVIDDILEDRFTNFLPQLMRREGIDMWVIISREYNRNGGP